MMDFSLRQRRNARREGVLRAAQVLGFAFLLSGCAVLGDLFERDPSSSPTARTDAPTETRQSPTGVRPLQVSESLIASDIQQLGQTLAAMLARAAIDVNRVTALTASSERKGEEYFGTVSAIEQRLQIGSPPSNPVLIQQWNEAQAALDQMAWDVNGLDRVSLNLGEHDAAIANLELQLRTYEQSNKATQIDRRNIQQLLADAASARQSHIWVQDTILESMRQSARLLQDERPRLAQIQIQIIGGSASLAGDVMTPPRPSLRAPELNVGDDNMALPPLVIIRFDRPNVVYGDQLRSAINQARAIDPEMQFRVVAVSPNIRTFDTRLRAQAQASQFAQSVMRSMSRLGVAEQDMTLAFDENETARSSEVHIHIQD